MTDNSWSASKTEVLNAAADLLASDREGVLATIIDVEGSAYRRPGAKMLVTADGEGVGAITAGCLEDEVVELARDVLAAGEPRVETYDLMEGDDDVWGLGVGCNGIIDVLIEPLDGTYRPAIEAFEAGEDVAVVTVVDSDAGAVPERTRAYHTAEGFEVVAGALPDWLAEALAEPADELAGRGRADTTTVPVPADADGGGDGDGEGTVTVFVDGVEAPPELVVFGSGHDVGPIVELAKHNDFRVTVVGFRGGIDLEDRFPAADRTATTAPANVREACEFDEETYAVVATHNFIDDRLTIDELVRTPAPYVGLMGPHERFEEMLEEFEDEGRTLSEEELAAVYTPVGLDLGGGSPYRIATSIVAEVLAVHNDRDPGHLRERKGHIHDRVEVAPEAPTTD